MDEFYQEYLQIYSEDLNNCSNGFVCIFLSNNYKAI